MTKRIFHSICIVAVTVFAATLFLIIGVLYGRFSHEQEQQLFTQLTLTARGVQTGGAVYLTGLNDDNYRVTWVASDGAVLYDSDVTASDLENHLQREEIHQALENGTGKCVRTSATTGDLRLYVASRLSDGTVIRLSDKKLTLWSMLRDLLGTVLIAAVISAGLAFALAYGLSKSIVRPLNELNLDDPKPDGSYPELYPLIGRLRSQRSELRQQALKLERRKKEFEAATGNMAEGIVLLNENGTVLSINESALRLLGVTTYCIGKDLLLFTNSPELRELLMTAGAGERSEMIIPVEGVNYRFYAGPVLSDGKVSGITLIIFDITEKEKAEQIRREFTANVSHELKTPLQIISGCAELLSKGLVQPEDISGFSERIYAEARRLISLVEDIIRLSHLDEGIGDMPMEDTDLFAVASQTINNLLPVAEKAQVSLALEGDHATIHGVPRLLSVIVYNLCDNAIKYNRPGGSVTVCVSVDGENVRLAVSDTGIGIPAEQQDRIFERFYRVDKSRSNAVGGTGLGLSIVKRAAMMHHAGIELKSTPGEGTTVTVLFPRVS